MRRSLAGPAACAVLLVYAGTMTAASLSTASPGSLGVQVGACGNAQCLTHVQAGGVGWSFGMRAGLQVIEVNGIPAAALTYPIEPGRVRDLLLSDAGQVWRAGVGDDAVAHAPMKFSLWAVGAVFAVLGGLLIFRQPAHRATVPLASFLTVSALSIAVTPSAADPTHPWPRIVMFTGIVGIGALSVLMARSLGSGVAQGGRSLWSWAWVSAGGVILLLYSAALFGLQSLYPATRAASALYAGVGLLTTVGVLGAASRRRDVVGSQARIVLAGMGLGSLPMVALTLVPEAVGVRSLVPVHFTILPAVLIPVTLVQAVLQRQLLGIRRLVHRGLVYAGTTITLVVVAALLASVAASAFSVDGRLRISPGAMALVVVASPLLFLPIRAWVRRAVDAALGGTVEYSALAESLGRELLASAEPRNVAQNIAVHLTSTFRLEAVVLFLGSSRRTATAVARAGPRADEVVRRSGEFLPETAGLAERQVLGDPVLLLDLGGEPYRGYLVLGPRAGGEPFLESERRLISALAPLIGLALEKTELAEELQDVNSRLIGAEERERMRIASDLHDGPLQKVLLIAAAPGTSQRDQALSREIATELREIGSRLRPSVLDDLGLPDALEWLADGLRARSGLTVAFGTRGVATDARYRADVELALFRVAQEATNNTVKHARAHAVEIVLSQDEGALRLDVRDDGVGVSGPTSRDGFGLAGMRERMRQVGGQVEIRSAQGRGTIVTATVGLPTAARPRSG